MGGEGCGSKVTNVVGEAVVLCQKFWLSTHDWLQMAISDDFGRTLKITSQRKGRFDFKRRRCYGKRTEAGQGRDASEQQLQANRHVGSKCVRRSHVDFNNLANDMVHSNLS